MILGLFVGLMLIATLFLFYSFLKFDNEFYLEIISSFLSSIMFFILGFVAYGGLEYDTKNIQYPVVGLFFVVIGVIVAILGFLQIIDIAISEFNYGSDETERSPDYEYK